MDVKQNLINIKGNKIYISHLNSDDKRPTLVFLHDSLGCTELWRDFPVQLGVLTKCNILVYDRLGYGKSAPMPDAPRPVDYMEPEADMLYELLNTLKIKDPILFGHSDGGTIALLAAAKYPEKIKAVIAEAAHIFVEDITLKGIKEAIEAYKDTNLRQRLEKYHGSNTGILFKAWTQTWTREDFKSWNIISLLPAINCPVLIIQGLDDEFGSLKQVDGIAATISGKAERQLIPDCGHTPHKEAAQRTLTVAANFINRL